MEDNEYDKLDNNNNPADSWDFSLDSIIVQPQTFLWTRTFNPSFNTWTVWRLLWGNLGDNYHILWTVFHLSYTYQVQKTQLDIAKKNADLEIFNKLYSEILQEVNSIQYRRKIKEDGNYIDDKGKLFTGIDALYNFDENHWHSPNSVLNHINSIMISFDQLILMTDTRFKYKHKETKDILLTKIYLLFYSKITWPVYQEIYRFRRKDLIEKGYPDSPSLFKNYERLTKQTYDYLLKGGHVGKPADNDKEMVELLKN